MLISVKKGSLLKTEFVSIAVQPEAEALTCLLLIQAKGRVWYTYNSNLIYKLVYIALNYSSNKINFILFLLTFFLYQFENKK